MNYKTITITRNIEFDGSVYEDSITELKPFLDEGYKIISESSSHLVRPNVSQLDLEIKPTMLSVISTYLLVLE